MNQFSNMLKSYGIKKGDRIAIYMPTSTIAVAAMLACARIGAIHSVVFAGFSAEALASRINDCKFWLKSCHKFRILLNISEH
jgi:acetyl-CoA synthetase